MRIPRFGSRILSAKRVLEDGIEGEREEEGEGERIHESERFNAGLIKECRGLDKPDITLF